PLVRFLQQFLSLSKFQAVGWASFDTSRFRDIRKEEIVLLDGESNSVSCYRRWVIRAVGAVCALFDFWRQRIPLRCWHTPRTSPDAVTASDTFTRVIGDRAIGLPRQCSGWACRCARRIQAMETAVHREYVVESSLRLFIGNFVKADKGVCLCA